jgi:uncharacterized protein (TIGR03435 family)
VPYPNVRKYRLLGELTSCAIDLGHCSLCPPGNPLATRWEWIGFRRCGLAFHVSGPDAVLLCVQTRALALAIFGATALAAQFAAQPAARPEIEVASVKANKSVNNAIGNKFGPQSMSWTNASLNTLIGAAYNVPGYRMIGAGGWMDSERWDINAKITVPTRTDEKFKLLQPLLAGRFHLKCHWETRELPLYRLVVAPGGPKFKESTEDERGGIRVDRGFITGRHTGITNFIYFLAGELQQTIVDETGLQGEYSIDLRWSPTDVTTPAAGDPPDLFAAMQEELGLKLKASKGPVEVLVVEKAERPTEN